MTTRISFRQEPSVKQAFTKRHCLAPLPLSSKLSSLHRAPLRSQKWRSNAPNCPGYSLVCSGVLLIFHCFVTELWLAFGTSVGGSGVRATPELRPSAQQIPTSSDTSLLNTSNSLYHICIITSEPTRIEDIPITLSMKHRLESLRAEMKIMTQCKFLSIILAHSSTA